MEYLLNPAKGYKELWKAIIRPPRAKYDIEDLGTKKILIGKRVVIREDMELKNSRDLNLQCSWWKIESRPTQPRPVVIYLHGNSSCRVEATEHLKQLVELGVNLFSFDFAGCGKSDGEYISLGYFESEDVKLVVDYLRKQQEVSLIGLWGRSMGAVSTLMHADRDPGLACIVLDSPFCSLKELA